MFCRWKLKRTVGRLTALILACAVTVNAVSAEVMAASSAEIAGELQQTRADIAAAEADQAADQITLNDTYGRLDDLKTAKDGLQAYLDDLTAQINALTEALTDLETQIADKNAEIESTRIEVQNARADEEKQYDSMKVRIRYMYENGEMTVMNAVLGSKTITDFLNRVEEIRQITAYDRKSLDTYKAACEAVENKELELLAEEAALEDLKAEQEAKQAEVQALADGTSAEIASYMESIQAEEETAAAYEAQIADRKARIEELQAQAAAQEAARQAAEEEERRRAEEERRAAEEAARKAAEEAERAAKEEEARKQAAEEAERAAKASAAGSHEDTGNDGDDNVNAAAAVYSYSQSELELIWAIVAQEDDKSYTGALAVISCAMNRADINYGGHGRDPLSQLTAYNQFCYSPTISASVHWQRRLGGHVPSHVKQAVSDCLTGGLRNHKCLYFRSYNGPGRTKIGGNYYF